MNMHTCIMYISYHQYWTQVDPCRYEERGRGEWLKFRLIFGQFILTFEIEAIMTHI